MHLIKTTLLATAIAAGSITQTNAAAATQTAPAQPERLQTALIDHVGINVPDIDQAIGFFRELAGARVIADMSPGKLPQQWKDQFRWHRSSELQRFVMLQLDGGAKVELFQYQGPDINPEQPHEDDIGASHLALKTTDIARSLAAVKARGLKVLNEPITNPDGVQWFYFLTPWGSQIELVSSAG